MRTEIFKALALSSILIVTSCTKHSIEEERVLPTAIIKFTSPFEGQSVAYGDSLTIKAIAYSTDDIHGYLLTLKKVGDTTIYFQNHVHVHADTLLIEQGWRNLLSTPTALEANLAVLLDDQGHTSTSSLRFTAE